MKNNARRAVSMIISLMLLASTVVGCTSNKNEEVSTSIQAGTYTASEKGYGGDVTVEVKVDEDKTISDMTVNSSSETPEVGGAAAPQIAENIVKHQSLAVDCVAGATITSKAVITAAENALKQSGIDTEALKNKAVEKNGENEELTADVVVVGAGGSGTAAALAAAQAGKQVVIIEKTAAVGGNSKIASGMFAVESSLQEAAGYETSVDEAVKQLIEFNNYLSSGPVTRAIVEKSASTIDWLQEFGVELYLQEDTTQFSHAGDVYKANSYHKYVNSGEAFDNLYKNLDKMGATLYLNTSLASIIQDKNGVVTGITATKADGGELKVNAKSTVICTGGFGADTQKVSQQVNTPYMNSLGMPNAGEGLELMQEAGAIDWDSTPLLHACQFAEGEVKQDSDSDARAGYSTTPLTQLLMSPLLWVDASGTRFCNEDVVYDTAYWANAAYAANGRYYMIVDKATLEAYTAGSDMLISEAGPGANMDNGDFVALANDAVNDSTVFKASSLEELAEKTGMNKDNLVKTVHRYNELVKSGADTDYHKADDSLKYTVESGEYYAFECRAVYLGTIGGVKVNENFEVVDVDYNPIQGLYTAGTNAGGYYEGAGYPPYEGLACGFAWNSGRIAGENAAIYASK